MERASDALQAKSLSFEAWERARGREARKFWAYRAGNATGGSVVDGGPRRFGSPMCFTSSFSWGGAFTTAVDFLPVPAFRAALNNVIALRRMVPSAPQRWQDGGCWRGGCDLLVVIAECSL